MWGLRQRIADLERENRILRTALQDLIAYCNDDDRMGNFVAAVKHKATRALGGLDKPPSAAV
jgi:hypothetical protein